MENWPNEGYKEVAEALIPTHEEHSAKPQELCAENREQVLEIALQIHKDSIALAKAYFFETQHFIHITPQLFSDFLTTYKLLYIDKRNNLSEMRRRYEIGLDRLKKT
jgi:dynein heavy chain